MQIELTLNEQVVLDTAMRFFLAEVKKGAAGTMKEDEAVARVILEKISTVTK